MAKQKTPGFSGAVSVSTLPEVIQLYVYSNTVGVLEIQAEDGKGQIWFNGGEIIRASSSGPDEDKDGEEAFYEIMTWEAGEFQMKPGLLPTARNVNSDWQQLVIESGRRADEMKRSQKKAKRAGWTQRPPSSPNPPTPPTPLKVEPVPDPEVSWDIQFDDVEDPKDQKEEFNLMNVKDALAKLANLDGFVGACLVDSDSGMSLGTEGGNGLNLEVAAAGNTEVVRAKRKAAKNLNLKDDIEDILITLGKQYHLIRPLKVKPAIFFYVALDRSKANLAMARIGLADVEGDLQL